MLFALPLHRLDQRKVTVMLLDAVGLIVQGLFVLLRFTITDKLLFLLIVLDTGFVTFPVLMLSLLTLANRGVLSVLVRWSSYCRA